MCLLHELKLVDAGSSEVKNLLDKLVVLKLNGGLGTTMGCTGPKYAESDFLFYFIFHMLFLLKTWMIEIFVCVCFLLDANWKGQLAKF